MKTTLHTNLIGRAARIRNTIPGYQELRGIEMEIVVVYLREGRPVGDGATELVRVTPAGPSDSRGSAASM